MTNTPNAAELTQPGDDPVTTVVVVTGMSGAGRSTALKALEDLGYEAVDNLPLSLLSSLLTPGTAAARPLAIGVDARTRDFGPAPFLEELDELIRHRKFIVRVLFLNCDSEVLQRRFSETRRRHPVTPDRRVTDGIKRVRCLADFFRQIGHFGNAAGVIGDRPEGIKGNNDPRQRQHGGGGDGYTE